jgi:uncharacterized protein (TIGR02246 family)
MNIFRLSPLALIVVMAAGCTAEPPQPVEPPDNRAADEAAIRSVSKEWAAAAQAKDPAKFASFYTDDAVVILEAAPDVSGKSAIQETLGEMMKDPAFALSFETKSIEVARSGDLAYELASFTMTGTDPKTRKPLVTKGQGLTVWKKQPDGSWKAHIDVPVSDPPEQAK